ncbi:MAG: adenylate/guanylate cyclase domain-containing protein [Deltaproteobacteria bacterium]|nr:adenylate/guanylate cyclase domain-containing protein [Deltaproteobacteria bacterium]
MSVDANPPGHAESRRLAAIMFTDIVGFSRQMGADEARMLRLLEVHNQLIRQAVVEHHGSVIKTVGDAFLVDFPSVVHAVQCAQAIQAQFRTHNAEKVRDEQIHVRIGIHLGDIVQRDGDVFGDGVNIASRLQALAEPDTICISDVVYRDVAKKLDLGTVVSLGRPTLKNIAERFQVYALLSEQPTGIRQKLQVQRLKLSRRVGTARRLALASSLLVVLTLVAVRYFPSLLLSPQHSVLSTQEAQPPLPLPDKPSLVVLPFANMSSDPEQEYFSDGLTEDLASALSKLSGLFVISRNSASTYKGKPAKVQEVSKELGVQYVLEGSVRKADGQVRVTAQLIDALQDHHLWTERYNRPLKDIFALQDEIVQKIVTTLKLQLTLWEQGVLVRKTTSNVDAYDFFLRGLESFHRSTQEANAQARQMFEKALELDPQYAEAYARLGWTYSREWASQWTQDPQALGQAFDLAQKAVALDDSLPGAHLLLGDVHLWRNRQHDQAIAEAERAIALDPNNAEGYVWLAHILKFVGRSEEAIQLVEKAMRLNPQYPFNYLFELGVSSHLTGRYEEALVPLKKILVLNPNFVFAHVNLAICYAELGRLEEARAEAAEVLRLNPKYSLEVWRQITPFKDPTVSERLAAALRQVGLK